MTNRLLPVALIAALVGGSVGAFVMHSKNSATSAAVPTAQVASRYDTVATQGQVGQVGNAQFIPAEFDTVTEQSAYKAGLADGCLAAQSGTTLAPAGVVASPSRVVYRNNGRSYARSSSPRAYSNYQQPRSRSFWQKHRDKLTVAMGAGAGAAVGGLVGGKKGAGIGALAGGGGSALYTYKLRNRSRRY
ncbi:MAG: hypothetical protein ACR2G5_12855 [Pyrinomonadaceae bacterium]